MSIRYPHKIRKYEKASTFDINSTNLIVALMINGYQYFNVRVEIMLSRY